MFDSPQQSYNKERHWGDSFLIWKYFRYEPLEDARTVSLSNKYD